MAPPVLSAENAENAANTVGEADPEVARHRGRQHGELRRLAGRRRRGIRREFEERFTASRMASDYVAVYEDLIGTWPSVAESRRRPA